MFEAIVIIVKPELAKNEFDYLMHLVSPDKQERIRKFHFSQDARNCLLGDCLARIEICRATGFSNKQLEFSINSYGKPFLVNRPNIHFNISHAGNYVVCAVSDEPVGVDIEIMKPIEMKIAERFFASDEVKYIKSDDTVYRFYEVWTKKESKIKWEGKGLHMPLTSFSVFELSGQGLPTYHCVFQSEDAICHVCSVKQTLPSVRFMDTATFIKSIM